MRLVLVAMVLALAATARAAPPKRIVVVTDGWKATTGALYRFARDGRRWRQVGAMVPVVVGKAGLKWPAHKREGDGASPAGRMALGDVTGYGAHAATSLRYRVATPALRCVDDARSPAYNTLAEAPDGGAPWSSDEQMRRDDELYRLTVFVRHNPARTPLHGSCIFLHVWKDAHTPTVGCTAMALDDLVALVAWADAATELVQLPRDEYVRRQREWDLPPLPQRK